MLTNLALVATAAVGLGCGDDDPTGPDSVTFPEWPAPLSAVICVRGTALVGDTRSGTISDADCDSGDADPPEPGYFETWRVRVATARDVTFDANSTFDNFLTVLRVNSISSTRAEATVLSDNDNRSEDNLNALVTLRLEPNVDYVVVISGLDYTDTGPYTLAIR